MNTPRFFHENTPLDFGKEAYTSGSWTGMNALASAYKAHGMPEKALKIYCEIAVRYVNSSEDPIVFMIRDNRPESEVVDMAEKIVACHPDLQSTSANAIMYGVMQQDASVALLTSLLEGPCKSLQKERKQVYLLIGLVGDRRFEKAVASESSIAGLPRRTQIASLLARHAALLLSEAKGDPRQPLAKINKLYYPPRLATAYLMGKLSAADLEARYSKSKNKTYMHWALGITAEKAGDTAIAMKHYENVVKNGNNLWLSSICKKWLTRMKANKKSTPATTPTPTSAPAMGTSEKRVLSN